MAPESENNLRLEIGHVLFVDLVGYSKLLIEEQKERLAQLIDLVLATAQVVRATNEELVRLPTGDGMALVFRNSSEEPAHCALEIAQALKAHPEIAVRIGIHSGPVSEVRDVSGRINIAGAGINMAQRVMDCGDAGHILLSQRVAEDLAQYRQWSPCLHDLGECQVKHSVRLHVVNLYTDELGNPAVPEKFKKRRKGKPAAAVSGRRATRPKSRRSPILAAVALAVALIAGVLLFWQRAPVPSTAFSPLPTTAGRESPTIPEKSIAILPFENLSRDPDNTYFADGIHDEILTDLSKIADLKVISGTSTEHYISAPDNLPEIGKQLRVAHIVEGRVQKSGDAVRVNVQLIKAANDSHLWAETYDRKLIDTFAIETEIAKAVAEKLQAKITGREATVMSKRPTENSEAHQLYLKGRYFWNKRTADGLKTAISYFSQAIEKDPAYAPAYAGLADAYAVLPNYSQTPGKEAYAKAEAAAEKALEIDDSLAEAHISLANVRLWHRWGNGAEPEFKRGLELNPNYSTGHQWYSIYLSINGRDGEAIAEMERAKELDPFSIIINTEVGCPYLYSKRYEQAIEYFGKAIEMDPAFPFAHFALAEALDRKGRYKEALEEHDKAIELARADQAFDLAGGDAPRAWYALTGQLQNTYGALGGANYWQRRLEATRQSYEKGTTTATAVAEIQAILGDNEQALGWLKKAYQESDDFLVFIGIQPQFENLHSDERYRGLVQKIFHPLPQHER